MWQGELALSALTDSKGLNSWNETPTGGLHASMAMSLSYPLGGGGTPTKSGHGVKRRNVDHRLRPTLGGTRSPGAEGGKVSHHDWSRKPLTVPIEPFQRDPPVKRSVLGATYAATQRVKARNAKGSAVMAGEIASGGESANDPTLQERDLIIEHMSIYGNNHDYTLLSRPCRREI